MFNFLISITIKGNKLMSPILLDLIIIQIKELM